MKGHSRVNSKKLSCSFHSDIFPNVSYHRLKGWKSTLESKAFLSMSVWCPRAPAETPVRGWRGVTRLYQTLICPLEENEVTRITTTLASQFSLSGYKRHGLTSCVPGSRNLNPFLWSDSVLHILGEVGSRMLTAMSAVRRISFTFVGNKRSVYMNKSSK